MSLLEIPVRSDLRDYEQTIDLEGTVYLLRFKWNQRAQRWTLDISTEAGELILAGVALVTSWPLLEKYKDERLPPGTLFVWDTTDQDLEPTSLNFGNTVLLMYQEASA